MILASPLPGVGAAEPADTGSLVSDAVLPAAPQHSVGPIIGVEWLIVKQNVQKLQF